MNENTKKLNYYTPKKGRHSRYASKRATDAADYKGEVMLYQQNKD